MSGAGAARAARDWDAETYHRVADLQTGWGLEVLHRLKLRGDEVVLDAGCGTGRVTSELVARLPHGRVIAVDASPAMIEKARAALPEDVQVFVADLSRLDLDEPVDAILSTAVFHWIADHPALFARLHGALRPGGRLEAQCGGKGNVASLRRVLLEIREAPPFADHLSGWDGPWTFASASATADALAAADFADINCWLDPRPVRPEEPREFLRTVTLGFHLERLPEELHAAFVDTVADRMGDPLELDYVRLNISARRP